MKKILVLHGCQALWFLYKKELICRDRMVLTKTHENKYLQIIENQRPDLIIMDNMIPANKQKSILKKIRKNNKELPIILHSFVSGETLEVKDLFLTKSYNLNELKHKANMLLDRREVAYYYNTASCVC